MTLSGFTYTCVAGEKWDEVSYAIYGDEKYAPDLLCANPRYCDKMIFTGGETLVIPVVIVPETTEEDETDFMSEIAPWKE